MAIFAACKVELRGFDVPADQWRKPYPHGNKIIACTLAEAAAGPDVQRITFLDTDMLCRSDFARHIPLNNLVMAVPEGVPTWGKSLHEWTRAYAYFDLPLPEDRITLVRGRKIPFVPYFNAGCVSFPCGEAANGKRFAAAWNETARLFDHCPIAEKRPWLDQITLPLTFYRCGFAWAELHERFNYSLSDRTKKKVPRGAKLLHYHKGAYLAEFPDMLEQALLCANARLNLAQQIDLLGFLDNHLALGLTTKAA
jgi:hypothetical protein